MAEALIFHYRENNNLLAKTHPFIKLIGLILLCIPLVKASLIATLYLLIPILFAMYLIKMPLKQYLKELIFFFILSFIIGFSNYLSSKSLYITFNAILKFDTAVLASLLLADTTDPSDLARSLGKVLNKIPFINGWLIASQIELTLSCIPLIFDTTTSIREARLSRLENSKKHPIKSFFGLTFSMMDNLLQKIDEMAYALDSRNFKADEERESIKYQKKDFIILSFSILLFIGGIVL